MSTPFSTIEQAVAAIAAGEMVIVVDSPDRENEGDLVMAAQHVTARHLHFMATEARGLICAPMTKARLAALHIDPMVAHNTEPTGTAFHVSVDARTGTTTGISASDRAATIRALAEPTSQPADFSRPGHVFPLAARDGGVLERTGHTEAALDLLKLAGLGLVGVICEIADTDGEMARVPTLLEFADRHQLPIITIADLVTYRRRTETLIYRVGQARLPLPPGEFTAVGYRETTTGLEHIALVHGDIATAEQVLVGVHFECLLGDAFGSQICECGGALHRAFDLVIDNGAGVIVYLRGGQRSDTIVQCAGQHSDAREVSIQILADLGVAETFSPIEHATEARRPPAHGQHPCAAHVTAEPIKLNAAVRTPHRRRIRVSAAHPDYSGATPIAAQAAQQ
jgi:3,4-dihydroxy 2-butanone 4-phosphate synthase/GTP cyclohydrolase II